MREGISRRIPKRDKEADLQSQVDDARVEKQDRKEKKMTERRHSLEFIREKTRVPSREGFHTVETLQFHLAAIKNLFEEMGYEDVHISEEGIQSYHKTLLAAPITARVIANAIKAEGWITAEFLPDCMVAYRSSLGGEIIDTIKTPEAFEMEWLKSESESSKVVKSRPAWMYPMLFDLPAEEVWPKDAKVAVIGDPFQACDKEGVTIIEYEYSDEMLPPLLERLVDHSDTHSTKNWLKQLYFEDVRAFDRMYGGFAPENSNPYLEFVKKCFALCEEFSDGITKGRKKNTDFSLRIDALKRLGKVRIDGSWTLDDGKKICETPETEEDMVALFKRRILEWRPYTSEEELVEMTNDDRTNWENTCAKLLDDLTIWHEYKENSLKKLGDPEAWQEFINRWESYLGKIPMDILKGKVVDLDKKIAQVRHWLLVLPASKSPDRVTRGLKYLEDFFQELMDHYDRNDPIKEAIYDDKVAYASAQDSANAFDFFLPGHPISLRHKNTLEEALWRIEQLEQYKIGLLPNLRQEMDRIKKLGVPFKKETLYEYLKSLEKAWSRQHFFRKRTQRAVPIHGFFPYDMPEIDLQDRILALTSVSMHGWNSMREKDFYNEILLSLKSLKEGGKYILGPINQRRYFGGVSNFDGEGLTRALQHLRDEGLIEYEFKKGVRDYGDSEEPPPVFDTDNHVLHDNESAHSLVITRL